MVSIEQLIDDAKCYEVVRNLRWPEKVHCPQFDSTDIKKRGIMTATVIANAMFARCASRSLMT